MEIEKKEVPASVPVNAKRQPSYQIKNERSNIVSVVTPHGDVRIEPFATVTVSKAIAESMHTLELVDAGVLKLSIN